MRSNVESNLTQSSFYLPTKSEAGSDDPASQSILVTFEKRKMGNISAEVPPEFYKTKNPNKYVNVPTFTVASSFSVQARVNANNFARGSFSKYIKSGDIPRIFKIQNH